jgi:hypothetical protein
LNVIIQYDSRLTAAVTNIPSSGMYHRVVCIGADVSEERIGSIFRGRISAGQETSGQQVVSDVHAAVSHKVATLVIIQV